MPSTSLGANIAPAFFPVHHAVKRGGVTEGDAFVAKTHFWLMGGRGSTKSSFAAIQVVLGIIRDKDVNAVCVRKVGNTLRDSVYAQILWAIDTLGVSSEFNASVSPMEIVYRPTGQRVLFRGADKPEKLKSITTRTGYVGIVWYEELDQFYGLNEIRSINQSLLRGGEHFRVFYTYNPPRSRDSWVNKESMLPRDDRFVHTSTYLDVPRHWLGEQFFIEAETLLAQRPDAYRHEYLGEAVGTGGNVFGNLEVRAISDEDVAQFDRVYNGVDWGYYPDPWCFERVHYDAARQTLYVFDEAYEVRAGNDATAAIVRAKLGETLKDDGTVDRPARSELVTCDSAEPKSVRDYRSLGIDARPVPKGPGSVEYGMKWLASRARIIIDPVRCPLAAEEFSGYEHERTRDGEYVSGYPDKDNHAIDATRYAVASLIALGR